MIMLDGLEGTCVQCGRNLLWGQDMTIQKWVLGNWKMNGRLATNEALLSQLGQIDSNDKVAVGVAVPSVYLLPSLQAAQNVLIGSEDVSRFAADGAYTGEISAAMLADIGAQFTLIGHSERRQYFAEDETVLAQKYAHAVAAGVLPVLCVGETLEQREAGQAEAVVAGQLAWLKEASLLNQTVLVAYEPVWAIGTGVVASIDQIAQMHTFIQEHVLSLVGNAANIRLLYGGSVNAENCAAIFAVAHVDGALVGGASLKADSFANIITAAISAAN